MALLLDRDSIRIDLYFAIVLIQFIHHSSAATQVLVVILLRELFTCTKHLTDGCMSDCHKLAD